MNNKVKYILVTIFLFFLFIAPVKADNCSTIESKINDYDSYEEELKELDCTNKGDEQIVAKCNDLKLKKNIVVTYLMKQKEEKNICDSQTKAVDTIIKENEDHCSKIFDDNFTKMIDTIMTIFYILGPILLIVFGSLDYAKATVSGDEKSLKKAHKTFFKRMLATVLLFLSPVIVNFIIKLNASDYILSGNAYACDYEYTLYSKEWNIQYTAKQKKNTNTTATSNGSNAITSEGGQAIADAAKQIKEYTSTHGYTYAAASESVSVIATDNQKSRHMVCATIVAAALYRANIYDISKFTYGINSSPSTAEFLDRENWIYIEDKTQLQPGDIVFYRALAEYGSFRTTTIRGKRVAPGHVEIFAGKDANGVEKVYNAGSTSALGVVESNFSISSWRFVFAFRYPGKE